MQLNFYKNKKLNLTLQCCAIALDDDIWHGSGLLYLDIFGATEAMETVHAHLVKHRKGHNPTVTNLELVGEEITILQVVPRTKYHKIYEQGHLLIINPHLNRLNRDWLLGGDENTPSPWFRITLAQKIDVPFLPQWADTLWTRGLKEGLISPAQCWGVNCWKIEKQTQNWRELVLEII